MSDEMVIYGRGDPEHPSYVAVLEFKGRDFGIGFMRWEAALGDYAMVEFAGTCGGGEEAARSLAEEWAEEEGVGVE